MKKTTKSIAVLTAYLGVLLVTGCGGKDTSPTPLNCSANSQKVVDAATVYGNNPTKANCEAYKNSLRDFYKSCSNFYSAADKKSFDEFLAEPCEN
jgi:hypothetical protein